MVQMCVSVFFSSSTVNECFLIMMMTMMMKMMNDIIQMEVIEMKIIKTFKDEQKRRTRTQWLIQARRPCQPVLALGFDSAAAAAMLSRPPQTVHITAGVDVTHRSS